MNRIAIFASGSGTNAENIINYFSKDLNISVVLLLCNNPDAGVIVRAKRLGVPFRLFSKGEFDEIHALLRELKVDYLILAGFLLKVPDNLVASYSGRIINIHPALLPKYGGKGMYGMNVHNAVIAAKEKESGITIHIVDNMYDHGTTLFQAKCPIEAHDTPEDLAAKIHILEQANFPRVIKEYISSRL
ncbi:MAG: phosphoribosylglycinamide formyltransferase [Bacteroidales bacterium]|jgi:phosphoribosylglycinamide formyltransferase-1|nr:phosphoribosylglycinamide formyltransferase [Bacteroidales bacterium]MDD3200859.1 phosphoribosylglycinamide formyltransferase [Bacteroidales bacterium]